MVAIHFSFTFTIVGGLICDTELENPALGTLIWTPMDNDRSSPPPKKNKMLERPFHQRHEKVLKGAIHFGCHSV